MKHLSAFFRPTTNALSAWSVGLHSFFSHFLISAGSLPQRNVSVTSASAAIVGTPSRRRRGLMLKPLAFMLLFLLGSLNVWGTDVITPTSGLTYRIKATKSNTTYYLVAPTSTGLGGVTTTQSEGTVFTFTQQNSNWYITFISGNTTYYMSENSNNGRVTIGTSATSVAIGTNNNYIKIGSSKWIQLRGDTPDRIGCYSSSQAGCVLEEIDGSDKPAPSLDHIAITGTPSKTYEQGQSFDPTGLTVTAYYDDDTNEDVTGDVEWSFNPATFTVAGENKSVTATATYQEKEASETYNDITVNEHVVTPGTYDITLSNVLFGTSVNANITKEETGSQNDITLKINGTGSTKPRTDATYVRFYGSSSLTLSVPDGYNLTEIKITKNESDYSAPTVTVGSFNTSTKTWTGKAQEVVLSFSAKSFIDDIKVTYEAIAPEVTVDPEELSFEAKQNIAVEGKTFTLEGANLSSGLTLAASEGFAVSPTSITADAAMAEGGVEVTVTPVTPTATTTPVEGTVTISGGGLTNNVVVNLSMTVTPTYLVAIAVNDGDMGSATINGGTAAVYKASGETVDLVATPETGYEFVNWTATSGISFDNANNPNATATITAAGTITANFQVQACTSLAAPTLNGEIAKTYNSATIAWNAVENASVGYEVYVYNDAQKTSTKVSNLVTVGTSFEVDDLAANTTYYYTVMAVGDGTSYCEENNELLEGSFTTSDYPSVDVTYSENGNSVIGGSKKIMTPFALPDEVTNEISGKTFVGWTTNSDFEDGDESDEYIYFAKGADFTITSNAAVTLYAVYATAGSGDVTISSTPLTSAPEQGAQYVIGANHKTAGIKYFSTYSGTGSNLNWGTMDASTTIYFTLSGTTSALTAYDGSAYLKNRSGGFEMSTTSTTIALQADGAIRGSSEETATRLRYNSEQDTYGLRWYASNKSTGNPAYFYKVEQNVSYSDYVISGSAALPVLDAPTFGAANNSVFYESTDITISAADGASIYYTLDGTTPSSTNGILYEGAITLSEYGTYNFKAIAIQANHEDSEVAEATYAIGKVFASVSDLYTYLETNSLTSLNNVKVTGLVSRITTAWDGTKGYLTYYISDNGVAENDLQMYRGAGEGASALAVGDQVTVTGNYTLFQSTTHEFGAGNTIVARTAGAHDSYEIAGNLGKTNFAAGEKWLDSYLSGLSVNDVYNTGYKAAVSDVSFSADKTDQTALESTDTQITVTATKDQAELATKDFAITVSSATLVSIALNDGYKTEYYVGDELVKPTVIATLSDNSQIEEVATACTGYNMSVAGNYTVSVAFTYGNITLDGENGAEYQITVKKIFDNEDAPHTVAKAIELIEASAYQEKVSSTDYMWVRGKVVSEPNSSSTYYISDDGTSANQLTVWQGKYFTTGINAKNNVAQGDEVILKATIVNYNGNQAELTASTVVYQLREPAFAIADIVEADEFEAGFSEDLAVEPTANDGEVEFTLESQKTSVVTIVAGKLHAVAEGDAVVTATRAATDNANALNYKEKSITFNVRVIAARTRYTVTFDANGADGGSAPEAIADQLKDATVELPETNPYTKEGNKFMGWQVLYNEIVLEKALGESFTMPAANVTIKPKWEEVATCAISFVVNGAVVATANAPQDDIYNISQVGSVVPGFTFIGWSETEVSDEVEELPTMISTYSPEAGEESKVLYGIYSRVEGEGETKHYVLDYDTDVAAKTLGYGSAVDVTASDGSAWVVKAFKSNGMQINNGANSSIKIPTCPNNIISIAITGNSSKAVGFSTSDYTGSGTITYVVQGTDATSQNLSFAGKSVNAGYIVPVSKANQITHIDVEYDASKTLYTSYPVEKVTITFDVNGGEGGCEKAVINKGSQLTICAEEPTKTHSDFTGWKNGDDVYVAGQAYTFDADITLTAQWDPAATYAVTYSANGATAGIAPTDATEYYAGDEVTVLGKGDLEKDDYDFQGWKYDGKLYAAGASFTMPASAVEFVAQWKKQNISTETMTLVTSESQLADGSKVVIAINNEQYQYLAGQLSTTNSKYLIAENTGVTFSGTEVTYSNANVTEWTLVKTAGGWQLMNGDNYLGENGDNLTVGTINATVWNITISNGNIAMTSGDYTIRFNPNLQSGVPSTPRFKTYGSTSTMALPQLYASMTAITNDASISDLGYVEGDVIVVNENKTLTMDESSAPASITVKNGATVAVNAETETNNLTVEAGGTVTVGAGQSLSVADLYIQSNQGGTVSSSQIINVANLNLNGDAYFDITFDNSAVTPGWYAFAVPFQVDVQNGIYNAKNGAILTNETDYAVMTYQGDVRANGEYGWIKVHKKGGKLVPGQLYIIAFGYTEYNKIRFKKDAGAALNTSDDVEIKKYALPSSDNADKGWNGIGNSTLHYADVAYTPENGSESIEHAQYLDHSANVFVLNDNVDIVDEGYVVGSAFFVQAPAAGIMAFDPYTDGSLHAPARNEVSDEFMLTISQEGKFQDRLFVSASETASNDYEIGHDLVKLGAISGAAKVAQIAVNGYNDINLCDAEFPLVNNQAIFPLVLTAPATGTYTIAIERYADADLYLTYQGTVIWNLTESPYDLSLMKGRTDEYGLLLNATGRGVSTGVEQQIEKNGVEKFVMNDQLYILHNGVLYNANGQKVK